MIKRRRSHNASNGVNATEPFTVIRTLTESGKVIGGTISLDGRYVAYIKRDLGKFELHLLQVTTDRDLLLQEGSPLRIWALHFSELSECRIR